MHTISVLMVYLTDLQNWPGYSAEVGLKIPWISAVFKSLAAFLDPIHVIWDYTYTTFSAWYSRSLWTNCPPRQDLYRLYHPFYR